MQAVTNLSGATREVFGNIAPWMRVFFYGLMIAGIGVLALRFWVRVRLWRVGVPGGFERDWRLWLHRIAVFAVGQKKGHRRSLGAVLHLLRVRGFVGPPI